MKRLVLVLLTAVGCVSAHKGDVANARGEARGLEVSGTRVSEQSSKNFLVVDFTLKNIGNEFVRIKGARIFFDDDEQNKSVKVVLGRDLKDWAEGQQNVQQIKDYNYRVFVSSMAAVGAGVAIGSNDYQTKRAGLALMSAGSGMLAINDIRKERNKIKYADFVPESHILSMPVNVPPGDLFLKKYVVLYIKDKLAMAYTDSINLELTYLDGKKVVFPVEADLMLGDKIRATNKSLDGKPVLFQKNRISIRGYADCERLHPYNQKYCRKRVEKNLKKK